jgi:hypothetical protein
MELPNKKHQAKAFVILIAFSLVFFVARYSLAVFSSANFELENPSTTVDSGGESASLNFQYISSTSQLDQGESSTLNFLQQAGFLYFPSVASTPPPPPPPPSGGPGPRNLTPEELDKILKIADFNRDGYVDLVDMSILLYWYGHTGPEIIPYDLSNDGQVDIVDASIVLYYWEMVGSANLG